MWITFVPVLGVLRRLYDMPRDAARFDAFTGLVGLGRPDALIPLSDFNPMGAEQVADALDALLAVEAEREAAAALRAVGPRLRGLPAQWGAELRVMLMLSDDMGDLWASRPATEMKMRVDQRALLSQHWVSPRFWTSDTPTAVSVRTKTLATLYCALHQLAHGPSHTVGGLLRQERRALAFAGGGMALPPAEEAALRDAVAPYLDARDDGTRIAVLFGDAVAMALGYVPRGVPERGGLRLAASEALREGDPIGALQD